MMRELATLAALGLLLIPGGADGFFGRRRFLPACPAPAYVYPPVVLAPPCLPYFQVVPTPPPMAAPPVYVAPATPSVLPVAPSPVPSPPAAQPKSPRVSVTPAAPSAPAAELARPTPALPPAAATGEFEVPELKSTPPLNGLNIPPTVVPGGRAAPPAVPKTTTDKPDAALQPSPDTSDLPPLSLPDANRIARYRPVAVRPAFDLFPSDAAPGVVGRVEFTNLTGRPVALKVDGRTAELPDRSALSVGAVGAAGEFRWSLDGGPVVTSRVPGGAAGAEVVLRP